MMNPQCRLAGAVLATVISFCVSGVAAAQTHYPALSLSPLESPQDPITPTPVRDGCLNPSQWSTVKARTDFYGNADWAIDMLTNSEQQTCCGQLECRRNQVGA